jgi:hypothetical protein
MAFEDPFLDPFTQLQLDSPQDITAQLLEIAEEQAQAAALAEGGADDLEEEPEIEAEAPVVVEDVAPSVHQFPDGATVSVQKGKRGWEATLNLNLSGVNPEVFYGTTKEQMWQNVAHAKLNATKKIREQNKQLKLGTVPQATKSPVKEFQVKPLTSAEIAQFRATFEASPEKALSDLFKGRTGHTIEDLSAQSSEVANLHDELVMKTESGGFLERYPDYHVHQDNYTSLLAWLSKNKLGTVLTDKNQDTTLLALIRGGHYTKENLGEAYEDLSESGLLITKPVAPKPREPVPPATTVAATAPAPSPVLPASVKPPASSREVSRTRQPRAGLGIRSSEATAPAPTPTTNQPPSAIDFEKMSDAEIAQLVATVAAEKRRSR